MRLDRTQKKPASWSAALFVVSLVLYMIYAHRAVPGPRGGSPAGLAFGVSGFGLMLFSMLLSVRKRFPVWRIGRAQSWMRGHLWFGLLAYPLILFHAGFSAGGSLTTALLWLLSIVTLTGVAGMLIQHFFPRLMTQRVPLESIYDDIDHVLGQLLREADHLIASTREFAAKRGVVVSPYSSSAIGDAASTKDTISELARSYVQTVRPFLATRDFYSHPLYAPATSETLFQDLRKLVPPEIQELVADLESVCEEKRDLDRQSRMNRILHGWLLVHAPLSYALILLSVLHAVLALRY